MVRLYGTLGRRLGAWWAGAGASIRRRLASAAGDERGQTTAEYALVFLAAAAVAFVLIAWATSTDKLTSLFDAIIDDIAGDI